MTKRNQHLSIVLPTEDLIGELRPAENLFEQHYFTVKAFVEHFIKTWADLEYGLDGVIYEYSTPDKHMVDSLVVSDFLGYYPSQTDTEDYTAMRKCVTFLLSRLHLEIVPLIDDLLVPMRGQHELTIRRWLGDHLVIELIY